ncbi:gluzincin family metallopeptidase [Psychroserpens ponticola]|uniref:Metalloprotease n=1 Tax=Psychroserpens ponticola TaxID=2932268 RepID=A0ABY7S0P1_9FLAO|nr:metalloprotease [Psychroserpens ponticola]WCO02954.1 metalloprotease [Psychroserpens ponticola]
MKLKLFIFVAFSLLLFKIGFGQNSIDLKADFDVENKTIHIQQKIIYHNTSDDALKVIYLNDWNNAYSTKKTPLAKRFEEEYSLKFHLAKNDQRGYTTITTLKNNADKDLIFSQLDEHPDIVKIDLDAPLLPNQKYELNLNYSLVLPDETFTGHGISKNKEFNLKYWYLTPAVYNGKWQIYSNKNLDDLYTPKAHLNFEIKLPLGYTFVSELNTIDIQQTKDNQTIILEGQDRVNTTFILVKFSNFKFVQTDDFNIISDISSKNITPNQKALITDKITRFITQNLGEYPHQRLLITKSDYKKDPLYGLNLLPDFIRPFPDSFQYELKLLKTALKNYLDNTLLVNPRTDYWIKEGIQIYYLMKYIETYYPDTKMIGTLANIWGIRSFHAADLKYNDQFVMFYMQMARTNIDQALTTSKDSLLKFNSNIANKYKAGVGLRYLDDFVNGNTIESTLSQYLTDNKTEITSSKNFENLLKKNTDKDVDWFFTDYVNSRKKIDFKIKKVEATEDSITLTILNKRDHKAPVSLFTLDNDSILSKTWIENINEKKTITIPNDGNNKFALNYDNTIPEFNLRDNYKSLNSNFLNNKPLQFRLIQDVEDPYYNQIFMMPLLEFKNIYDGVTFGGKFYNKTLLRKRLNYKISPQYATNSKIITGRASAQYTQNIENSNLYGINYGFGASYASFAEEAFVTRITPSISMNFRNDSDFRSDEFKSLNFRFLSISRDVNDPTIFEVDNDIVDVPDYNVFNVRYVTGKPGIINFEKWFYDFQLAERFGKIAVNYEYRKLSQSNRQFNIRFFAGTFLYNKTDPTSDYFSFALDRPTDYLFDYNYLGRSESSGIFSQQIIIADGGFKSMLETPFANRWMTTINASTTIWRYVEAYGDIGLIKNRSHNPNFAYDSGIRLNLITDYFEVYFPIYSNLGWEVGQPNYEERIRILFTLDPGKLLGLFRRRWF